MKGSGQWSCYSATEQRQLVWQWWSRHHGMRWRWTWGSSLEHTGKSSPAGSDAWTLASLESVVSASPLGNTFVHRNIVNQVYRDIVMTACCPWWYLPSRQPAPNTARPISTHMQCNRLRWAELLLARTSQHLVLIVGHTRYDGAVASCHDCKHPSARTDDAYRTLARVSLQLPGRSTLKIFPIPRR